MTLLEGRAGLGTGLFLPPSYDENGTSFYYGVEQHNPFGKVMGNTHLVKTLRLGRSEDLCLHPFAGGLFEYVRTSVGEGVPVYVVDDHNHALFGWFEAYKQGRFKAGASLFHVDMHPDDLLPRTSYFDEINIDSDLEEAANYVKRLDINEFIAPAIDMGLINPSWRWIDPQCRFAEWKRTSWSEEGTTLKDYLIVPPEEGFRQLRETVQSKKEIIIDIDLDFFHQMEPERIESAIAELRAALPYARVVTIATSPGYIDQIKALGHNKALLEGLEN